MNSYSINELYALTPTVEPGTFERLNPLTEAGSLDEAELIDVRLSTQRSRIGIIFDLGLSLCFRGPNTALVVLTGVGKVNWYNSDSHLWGPHSWGARWGDWEPTITPDAYTIETAGMSDRLTISARYAEMYVGHVKGLDGPQPDMSEESDAAIIAGFPQWSSMMTVYEHYRYPEPEPARYTCLACGYPNLDDLPIARRGVQCPACGFRFGHTDTDLHYTYEQWRDTWIGQGMPWSSTNEQPPANWAPTKHLASVAPPQPGRYICLVCGYPDLTKPYGDYFKPSYEICPSCGYQYGHSDYVTRPIDWRAEWENDGMRWWRHGEPPENWSPQQQLGRLASVPRGGQVNGLNIAGRLSSF